MGCELALEYAIEGKTVSVVEGLSDILSAGLPVPIMNAMMIRDLLKSYQVPIYTGHRIDAITEQGAVITATEDGAKRELAADTVVLAVGFQPLESMKQQLFGGGTEVYEVGDGLCVCNIMSSVWDAYEVARLI